jgi:hypothetical protein
LSQIVAEVDLHMDLLWVFAAIAPVALGLLFAFAARVDPISGRLRSRQSRRGKGIRGVTVDA